MNQVQLIICFSMKVARYHFDTCLIRFVGLFFPDSQMLTLLLIFDLIRSIACATSTGREKTDDFNQFYNQKRMFTIFSRLQYRCIQ